MTRKTITFPDKLEKQISILAIKHDRSFSKQVVQLCKAEIARQEAENSFIVVVSNPDSKQESNK